MAEPILKKFPSEIFGFPYTDLSETAQTIRQQQICPFLNSTCKKPRKSEPHIKVGICSVGYKVTGDFHPIIICPHRFDMRLIYEVVQQYYLPYTSGYTDWVSEMSLGATTGSVDHVAVHLSSDEPTHIDDFVCVEIQAAGTTGTPWQAFLEHKQNGKFESESYNYGINWANEFAKTMMQQAYKKGLLLESWNKKLVFFVQDVAMQYLQSAYDARGLQSAQESDSIHFCTVSMVWNDEQSRWEQRLNTRLSTNTEGIRRLLGGIDVDSHPTLEQFTQRLWKKIHQSK
jgi:hypothetical protein